MPPPRKRIKVAGDMQSSNQVQHKPSSSKRPAGSQVEGDKSKKRREKSNNVPIKTSNSRKRSADQSQGHDAQTSELQSDTDRPVDTVKQHLEQAHHVKEVQERKGSKSDRIARLEESSKAYSTKIEELDRRIECELKSLPTKVSDHIDFQKWKIELRKSNETWKTELKKSNQIWRDELLQSREIEKTQSDFEQKIQNEKIDKLVVDLQKYGSRLESLHRELNASQAKIATIEQTVKEHGDGVKHNAVQLGELKNGVGDDKAKIATLERTIKAAALEDQSNRLHILEDVESHKAKLATLEKTMRETGDDTKDKIDQVRKDMEAALVDTKAGITKVARETTQNVQGVQACSETALATLRTDLSAAQLSQATQIKTQSSRLDSIEAAKTAYEKELNTRLEAFAGHITEQDQGTKEQEGRIAAPETKFQASESSGRPSKRLIDELQNRMEVLEADAKDNSTFRPLVQEKLNTVKQDISDLQKKQASMATDMKSRATKSQLTEAKSQLQRQIQETDQMCLQRANAVNDMVNNQQFVATVTRTPQPQPIHNRKIDASALNSPNIPAAQGPRSLPGLDSTLRHAGPYPSPPATASPMNTPAPTYTAETYPHAHPQAHPPRQCVPAGRDTYYHSAQPQYTARYRQGPAPAQRASMSVPVVNHQDGQGKFFDSTG